MKTLHVMAGLGPAIHAFLFDRTTKKPVDARHKAGHDVMVAVGLCGMLMLANSAMAQEVTIRFGAAPVPQSPLNQRGVAPFIKAVQDDAGGTLKINVFPGATLGDPRHTYDNTLKGVYDVSFGMFGVVSSNFPKTHVTTLPFINRNAHEASVALWRLYENGTIASEFAGVHPLAIYDFVDTRIHSRKPVKTLEDMQGLKITATSRAVVRAVTAAGGSILTIPPSEVYQVLQRGTGDAAALAWTAVMPFKIFEVTSYHLDTSLGMEPAYLLMNKATYDKLPAPAKAAFDKHAGLKLSEHIGRLNDAIGAEDRAKVAAMPNHTIYEMDAQEADRWARRMAPITAEWVAQTPDGAKVLAAYKAELEKVRASK
jgi:TRAP-type C4-dicarboxylate transport system substrate-binding protein